MVAIQMSQNWLNSEEISRKVPKNHNLEDSFYPNRPRVGITSFFFDCFAGKQEDDDLESAPSNPGTKPDESLTSALFSSTQILSSAVSSLTTGFASFFTWTPETKTFAPQELFEVVIEGEGPEKILNVIEDTKSPQVIETVEKAIEIKEVPDFKAAIEVPVIKDIEVPVIKAIEIKEIPVLQEPSAITHVKNTSVNVIDFVPPNEQFSIPSNTQISIESPKMNDILYLETTDKNNISYNEPQQQDEYVDPNDFWYKEQSIDEDDDDLSLSSRSFYAMPSYIDFSQDSSIKVQPIPKRKDSRKLKVHFEPLVELMDYVVNNDKASIKKVLQEGHVKVNDYDKLGYTMLHYAASHNHSDLMKFLIEKEGSEVNCVDSTNWTPLHLAAIADNFKACKVLLDHGANFEYPNCDDNLPIDLTEDVKVKKLLSDATKKKLTSKKVRAIYNWEAESPEHLTVKKSEGLKVLERRQELWLVQNDSKQIGLVPRMFIQ